MSTPATTLRIAVMEAIASVVDLGPGELVDDLDLLSLGLDSLDLTTIVLHVEDHLGREVPADVLDEIAEMEGDTTLGALLRILARWEHSAAAKGGLAIEPVVIDGTTLLGPTDR